VASSSSARPVDHPVDTYVLNLAKGLDRNMASMDGQRAEPPRPRLQHKIGVVGEDKDKGKAPRTQPSVPVFPCTSELSITVLR
jgi:hypothetical protein